MEAGVGIVLVVLSSAYLLVISSSCHLIFLSSHLLVMSCLLARGLVEDGFSMQDLRHKEGRLVYARFATHRVAGVSYVLKSCDTRQRDKRCDTRQRDKCCETRVATLDNETSDAFGSQPVSYALPTKPVS